MCDGLSEAHRLGVIHRDLKPQNIQIDKGGHAKIIRRITCLAAGSRLCDRNTQTFVPNIF